MGIISSIFGKKEKEVIELFRKHMEKVKTMSNLFLKATDNVMRGNFNFIQDAEIEVSSLEYEADCIMRDIAIKLYSGAFLTSTRGILYKLADLLDDVADKIENTVKSFIYLKKCNFPRKLREHFITMAKQTSECIENLALALDALFENKPTLKEYMDRVYELEHSIDTIKKHIFDFLLMGARIDNFSIRVIGDVIDFVSSISDAVEDCCDQIEVIKITKLT